MLGPMSVDRRRPVAAVLALLGALLAVAAVIGTAVHYAAQPDAAVGTPPGSSAWDRMQAGAQREGSDLLDRAAGREPEARVVEAPMPERTYGPEAADTYDGSMDTSAAAASLAGQPDRLEAPTRSISVGCSPSRAVDGALVLPEAPGTVWYDQSAQIGAPGASLIAGLETGAPVLVTDEVGQGVLVLPWAVGVTYEDDTRAVVHRLTGGVYAVQGGTIDAAGGWGEPGPEREPDAVCAGSDQAESIYVNSWP